MSQQDAVSIGCSAGCKRTVSNEDAALAASWSHLPISNRWRCLDCWRELEAVNARAARAEFDELQSKE